MDWNIIRVYISDIFNNQIGEVYKVFQPLKSGVFPLSINHPIEFSSNQAFPLRAILHSSIENSEVLATIDFKWKNPRSLRLKELMHLSDTEVNQKLDEFMLNSAYLSLEISADILLEDGKILAELDPISLPLSEIDTENQNKVIKVLQIIKTWFADNLDWFITRTPVKDGDFWSCGNCKEYGFKGKTAWHDPGSALCSVQSKEK